VVVLDLVFPLAQSLVVEDQVVEKDMHLQAVQEQEIHPQQVQHKELLVEQLLQEVVAAVVVVELQQ
jgi:hypothetical protein